MKHDYNLQNPSLDGSTLGTERFGFIQVHEPGGTSFVEKVTFVSSGGPDNSASFNVIVDGSALFSDPFQTNTSSGVPETVVPDQNRYFTGPSVEALFSVAASASAAISAAAGLLIDDGRD